MSWKLAKSKAHMFLLLLLTLQPLSDPKTAVCPCRPVEFYPASLILGSKNTPALLTWASLELKETHLGPFPTFSRSTSASTAAEASEKKLVTSASDSANPNEANTIGMFKLLFGP